MKLPTYQDFYHLLLKHGDSPKSADEYVVLVASDLALSEDQLAERYPSGEGVVRNRIRWAIHYLRRATLFSKPSRGTYQITELGIEYRRRFPQGLTNKELSNIKEFEDFRRSRAVSDDSASASEDAPPQTLTPTERLESASKELVEELKADLLDRVLEQSPAFFERLVVTLLSKMGYGSEGTLAQAIGKSGDGGIDGVIHQDRLGLDVVYIQAKRYDLSNQISRPDLQAFVGTLAGHQSTKGVFVTTSYFSKLALDYLKTVQTRIVPIDGDRLVELMIEFSVGTRVSHSYTVNKVDEDFFLG